MKYYKRIGSLGTGIWARYSTRSEIHYLVKGTVSYSTGSAVSFPIDLNATSEDIDYYDTSSGRPGPVYKDEYIDMLENHEKEHDNYSLPCILSFSVHKYFNHATFAAGMESVIIPYFPRNDGQYEGVHYKIAGYIVLGVRLFKKKKPSLPFMF